MRLIGSENDRSGKEERILNYGTVNWMLRDESGEEIRCDKYVVPPDGAKSGISRLGNELILRGWLVTPQYNGSEFREMRLHPVRNAEIDMHVAPEYANIVKHESFS